MKSGGFMRNVAWRTWAVGCLACLLWSSAPREARADDPDPTVEAKARYRQGTEAFAQKRFVEAALQFEAASALRPHAVTLYTAALAWDSAGQPERACDAYARALDLPGLDAKQSAQARDRVQGLERTLGTVVVKVPATWKIQLDSLTEVTGPSRLHGLPGAHVLTIRPSGFPVEKRDVSLEAGKAIEVEVTEAQLLAAKKAAEPPPPPKVEPPPPPKVEPPPPPPPTQSPLRPLGFVLAGTGGALVLSGVVLGTQALAAGDAYNASPTREGYDHATSLATWTSLALVGGIVVAAAGVTLALVPIGKTEAKVAVGPGSVVLGGTFQ
jgi:hypothetical protein